MTINIEIPSYKKTTNSDKPTFSARGQYEEWVARFCYASAKLPPATVEHILDLMETCSDSDSVGMAHKEGSA